MLLFFDCETTGLCITPKGFNRYHPYNQLEYYNPSRLVSICYKIYKPDETEVKSVYKLIKPYGYTISNEKFHGITNKEASERGITVEELSEILADDLKEVKTIVAHNIGFDINILCSELHRIHKEDLITKILLIRQECTIKMGTPICKLKSRHPKFCKPPKLIELYKHFFGEDATFKQHDAEEDVLACAKCYFAMIKDHKTT